ncbi:DUF2911 domain-containing protein [Fulvivirga sp. M361]|uniref:DUF2911 domain-containing protein n=1 Tax=Fulvivirga sp. M361 TaxID=2594266 RepID=UPI00162625C2|nr:DUF2911 domain-containing protein [Fulvivirga sp. M361]
MIKKIAVFCTWLLTAMVVLLASCNSRSGDETQTENREETAAEATTEKPKIASPRKQAVGKIAGADVVVDYGSPAVKGREVWGGLEAWGKVWRAGANETTSIEFSSDVVIGGQKVAAGKYGFYVTPNENADWIVIINTDWNREEHGAWGAYNYNEKHDVVRLPVTPEWKEEVQERLTYSIAENSIGLAWEKARITVPVNVVE